MHFSAFIATIVLATTAGAALAQDAPPPDHPDRHAAKPAPHRARQPLPPRRNAAPAPKKHEEPQVPPHHDHTDQPPRD